MQCVVACYQVLVVYGLETLQFSVLSFFKGALKHKAFVLRELWRSWPEHPPSFHLHSFYPQVARKAFERGPQSLRGPTVGVRTGLG